MCNLSEAVAEKAAIKATEETRTKDVDEFSRAFDLYRSGEINKDVYRENGISEELITAIFKE